MVYSCCLPCLFVLFVCLLCLFVVVVVVVVVFCCCFLGGLLLGVLGCFFLVLGFFEGGVVVFWFVYGLFLISITNTTYHYID